jgi:hypothetical protein
MSPTRTSVYLIKKLPSAPIDDITIKAIDGVDQSAALLGYRLTEGMGVLGTGSNFIL